MMGCPCGGFGYFGSYGWLGLVINLLFSLAVFGGLIWLVVWAVRRLGKTVPAMTDGAGAYPATAREILQARYARGEISREEYLDMLSDLS